MTHHHIDCARGPHCECDPPEPSPAVVAIVGPACAALLPYEVFDAIENIGLAYRDIEDAAEDRDAVIDRPFDQQRRLDELVSLLAACASLKELAGEAERHVSDVMRRHHMPYGFEHTVAGIGTAKTRRRNSKTVIDNARVASSLAARISDDAGVDENGELIPRPVLVERAVMETAAACGALTDSFSSWRKKRLAERSVVLEQFVVETVPGELHVSIDKRGA